MEYVMGYEMDDLRGLTGERGPDGPCIEEVDKPLYRDIDRFGSCDVVERLLFLDGKPVSEVFLTKRYPSTMPSGPGKI